MNRSASSILQRVILSNLFRHSLKPSPQFLPKILPFSSNPHSPLPKQNFSTNLHGRRGFCGGQPIEYGKELDEINFKFAEAREEIEAALESKETVYFDEEAEIAREAVKSAVDMFEGLLARLPERDRSALQRSTGLKMEQLKAEIQQLDD